MQSLDRQRQFIEGQPSLASSSSAGSLPPITVNLIQNYVAGNSYDRIEVNNGRALFGDVYGSSLSDPRDHVPNAAETNQIIEQLDGLKLSLDDARKLLGEQELTRQLIQKSTLAEWIGGFPAKVHHEQVHNVHASYAGTGSWILHNDKVAQWMNDNLPRTPILWMHGIPGAGE